MAELSRSFDGPVFGRGGIIAVGFVLALLASLFFIPEIIEFQKSLTGGGEKRAETAVTEGKKRQIVREEPKTEEPKIEELKEIPAAPEPSSLDKLSMFLDQKAGSLREPEAQRDDARASMGAPAKPEKASKSSQPRNQKTDWEKIRSGESKDALVKARKSALEISRRLSDRNSGTRYALFNFANGVDFVLERGSQSLTAGEAVSYVNSLDQAVTTAMNREQVDRSIQLNWVRLDLGPAISQGKGDRLQVAPFNPRLTLVGLKMQKSRVRGDPAGRLHVFGSGYVMGKDISRVELVNAFGSVIKTVSISKPSKNGGYRMFRFGAKGNDPLTIRVHDKTGMVFQKTYDFYGAVQGFRMRDPQHYVLPFRMTFATASQFAPENVDPALDAHFLMWAWRGTTDQLRLARMRRGGSSGLEDSAAGQLFSTF